MAEQFGFTLTNLAETLRRSDPSMSQGFLGFDGFVDEIIDVVSVRTSPDHYERIPTITDLADRIGAAAGLSTNLELVSTQTKLGGNGPIMANALANLGMDITYVGCVGYPDIHPVFEELAEKCQVYSIGEPGFTDALEFNDGKLLLGKYESTKDVQWERLIDRVPVERLKEATKDAVLVASLNWTMLPFMTDLWEHFLRDVLPAPDRENPLPYTFFDLADPQKRERHELAEAVEMIAAFSEKSRPILGLNRKEATEVAEAIGLHVPPSNAEAPLETITAALGEAIGVHGVVVHPTDEAAFFTEGRVYRVNGPFTNNPILTTGAGDNFNAGFCLGTVIGLSPEQCLILGAGTSGFYVRNGRSPLKDELADFLDLWSRHVGDDF